MRLNLIASAIAFASLACADNATSPGSQDEDPEVKVLTAQVVGGDGQSGVVASRLDAPLVLRVFLDGEPAHGVTVRWSASAGTIPATTQTDQWGFARADWTLGIRTGAQTAGAHLTAASGVTVHSFTFSANARPGPSSQLELVGSAAGSAVANAANGFQPWSPTVRPLDAYGNAARDTAVMWAILDGPIASLIPLQDRRFAANTNGVVSAGFKPIGLPGVGQVRAFIPGTAARVDFTLTVLPPEYAVHIIDAQYDGLPFFVSQQNRSGQQYSEAATDTIPVGATMRWVSRFWATFPRQRVVSVGPDSFPPSPLLANGESYEVVFDRAGTFRYANATDPSIPVGTIVVR